MTGDWKKLKFQVVPKLELRIEDIFLKGDLKFKRKAWTTWTLVRIWRPKPLLKGCHNVLSKLRDVTMMTSSAFRLD